jgi:hypothetical protein
MRILMPQQTSFFEQAINVEVKDRKGMAGWRGQQNGSRVEIDIFNILMARFGPPIYRQAQIFESIYGAKGRVDIYIPLRTVFPKGLIIESKWQGKSGTTDEKFPYLWLNIMECYPSPTIVVTSGTGARQCAIDWLKGKVDGEKLVAVYTSLDGIIAWANDIANQTETRNGF